MDAAHPMLPFWFAKDSGLALPVRADLERFTISSDYELNSDYTFGVILRLIEAGAASYNVDGNLIKSALSMRALNKFSRCCRQFYWIIYNQLARSRKIFDRWTPAMKIALHQKLINVPIKYTGETTICRDITMLGVDGHHGLAPIDHQGFIPDPDLRYALGDIIFITRTKRNFDYVLNIGGTSLCEGCVTPENYVELKLNDRQIRENAVIFGPDDNNRHAQYYCCLKLPTRSNPILIGRDFIPASQIFIQMQQPVMLWNVLRVGVLNQHDVDLMINTVTHVIARYKTVEVNACDWSKYIAAQPDGNGPIYKQSIIQPDRGQKRMCIQSAEDMLWQGIRGRPQVGFDGLIGQELRELRDIRYDIIDNFHNPDTDEPNADDLLQTEDYEAMERHAEWVRDRINQLEWDRDPADVEANRRRLRDEDLDRRMQAAWMADDSDDYILPVVEPPPSPTPLTDPVWTGAGNSLK